MQRSCRLAPMRVSCVLWLVAACTRANPDFCDALADCTNGFICDLETNACVTPPPGECGPDAACIDLLKPICGPDLVCRACELDDDCESLVCRTDGACESPENVLYAAPDGLSAGLCSSSAPCNLFFARALIDETRTTIRLANGTYELVSDFVANNQSITVVGGRGAVLERSADGAAFEVSGGVTLTLRGFTLNKGVSCTNATLVVTRVSFDNAAAETRPWISANGTVEVSDSDLADSTADGIFVMGSMLRVSRTKIQGSALDGIRCLTATCVISDSTIERNQQIGIEATTSARLEVARSSVSGNLQGGISSVAGSFDIANNFVFRNGNSKDAKFGGIRLDVTNGASRVEHNTIVFNDSDPFASPSFAGGLFCKGAGGHNNLIYNNFAGNNTASNAQTGGTCTLEGSLILNGNGTNEMHFLSPIAEPFDYHLADPQSPAANGGVPSTVTDDADREPRTDGLPDIGADELTP